jgi:hypothetical protein
MVFYKAKKSLLFRDEILYPDVSNGQSKLLNNFLLNCFSTVKFLKLKCFYIEKYYEKQRIFRNKIESIWRLIFLLLLIV